MAEDADEAVNKWLIATFRKELEPHKYSTDRSTQHLLNCPKIMVQACEHEWECGCYSSYTRDDSWSVGASFVCKHKAFARWGSYVWSWGNMPEIIKQIALAELEGFECRHDPDIADLKRNDIESGW